MTSRSIARGTLRSGRPCSAVQMALAWTSGPDMTSLEAVGAKCRSWSVGAEAPTTTVFPRMRAGSTRPR